MAHSGKLNEVPSLMLERFKSTDYYHLTRDETIQDEAINLVPIIDPEGIKLMAQYYSDKYGTSITYPADVSETELAKLDIEERNFRYIADWEFVRDAENLLKPLREQKADNLRHGFIVGPGTSHKIPVIYIREKIKVEGGEEKTFEGILFANTLSSHTKSAIPVLKELQEKTGIPVYVVRDQRQTDHHICGIDALIFGRDATAKDNATGKYRIPNLLAQLRARSEPRKGYHKARLPNDFLKTSQMSKFVTKHQEEDKEKKVHTRKTGEKETLAQFRDRYTFKDVSLFKGVRKNIPSYAKIKGLKFANLIEIQFYLNQFNKLAPELMKKDGLKNQFIREAKLFLKQQKLDDKQARPGLYEFAYKFLQKHIPNLHKIPEGKAEEPVPDRPSIDSAEPATKQPIKPPYRP